MGKRNYSKKEKKKNKQEVAVQNKGGHKYKHKHKKDKNMAWWDKEENKGKKNVHKTGTKKNAWWQSSGTIPTEEKSSDTLSVMLYKQSNLNEIAKMCKPKALGSEFQVHCRAAQIIIEKPDSEKRLVFTIPTYYYNMPQEVSTGSVDFSLDEVSEITEQVAPLSMKMVEQIGASFPLKRFQDMGFNVKMREADLGSLHRHPGDFGFSGTDMDNKAEKPGVIFRNLKCEDKIQVDSVMYIPGDHVKIVTTETRVVTVEPSEDEGIQGTYTEVPTACYILEDVTELVGFLEFFKEDTEDEGKLYKFKKDKKWFTTDYPQIEEVLSEFLDNMEYEPGIIVDPELIKQAYTYTHKPYNKSRGGNTYYGGYDPMDDEDDDIFYTVPSHLDKKNKPDTVLPNPVTKDTKNEKTELTRPTWRKTQALGLLRAKGVDVNNNAYITGSTSDKDTIAIVKALKDLKVGDAEIRSFFKTCAYPEQSLEKYYDDLAANMGK